MKILLTTAEKLPSFAETSSRNDFDRYCPGVIIRRNPPRCVDIRSINSSLHDESRCGPTYPYGERTPPSPRYVYSIHLYHFQKLKNV